MTTKCWVDSSRNFLIHQSENKKFSVDDTNNLIIIRIKKKVMHFYKRTRTDDINFSINVGTKSYNSCSEIPRTMPSK